MRRSNTPGGVFRFNRRVEGVRESALGGMFNPVYFNYGIAIHGAKNVPLEPASHGCIRIQRRCRRRSRTWSPRATRSSCSRAASSPRYGAQLPTFNSRDPDYVATTTTTVPAAPTVTTAPPVAPPSRR